MFRTTLIFAATLLSATAMADVVTQDVDFIQESVTVTSQVSGVHAFEDANTQAILVCGGEAVTTAYQIDAVDDGWAATLYFQCMDTPDGRPPGTTD